MGVPPLPQHGSPTVRILGPFTPPLSMRRRMRVVFPSTDAMSKTVVKPQRVSISWSLEVICSDESLSAWSRPGVRICTWLFQKPAVTIIPLQSTTVAWRGTLIVAVGATGNVPARASKKGTFFGGDFGWGGYECGWEKARAEA